MKIRYIGTSSYDELPVTGTYARWQPEQVGDVSTSRAAQLVATGAFVYEDGSSYANQLIDHAAEHSALGNVATAQTNAATGAIAGFQVGSDLLPAFGKTYTWATRPDATQLPGAIIFVSDIGGGAFFRSNGTRWKPVSAILPLIEQHTAVTFASDTGENTGFTFTVPAGLVMQNDSIEIYASGTNTNNANSKSWRVRIGGTLAVTVSGASSLGAGISIAICNRNSLVSQAVKNLVSGATSINTSIAVDMSVAQNLTVTMQKSTAGDTATLESVSVYLVRSAQ